MAGQLLPLGTWGDINIQREPNGSWVARTRYRGADGVKRHVKARGRTRTAARLALTARLSTQSNEARAGEISSATSVQALGELWLADRIKAGCKDATIVNYRNGIRSYVEPHLGQVKIGEVTKNGISAFFDRMDSLEAATAYEHARKILSGMFGLAVERDVLDVNPVQQMRRRSRHSKQTEGLSLDEVREVRRLMIAWETRPGPRRGDGTLGKTLGPNRANPISSILTMLLATGARIGEVLAIRWCDIELDSDSPTVTISGTIPNSGPLVRQDSTKTRAGTRTLVLPDYAIDMLIGRRPTDLEANPQNHKTWAGLVFESRNGTPLRPTNVRKQWRHALEGSPLSWVHPHTIRAVVATAIDRATDVKTAAAVLGHSSEAVTREHYVLAPEVAPDVRAALEQFKP